MFWKYIEKINWKKEISNIFLLKNKRLYISISYKGYFGECGLKFFSNKYAGSYGWELEFTVCGMWFYFVFYDKREYNANEGRFYLEDEPTWLEFHEENYLERVKSFMQKHPELQEGYYERVVKEMQDNQSLFSKDSLLKEEQERQQQKQAEQRERNKIKEFLTKLSTLFDANKIYKAVWPYMLELPWWRRLRKRFYVSEISIHIGWYCEGVYRVRYEREEVFLDSFSSPQSMWYSLPEIISDYDLYDKEGNLLSRASDYKAHTKYKRISSTAKKATRWYLYDKNGNLLYEKRYR